MRVQHPAEVRWLEAAPTCFPRETNLRLPCQSASRANKIPQLGWRVGAPCFAKRRRSDSGKEQPSVVLLIRTTANPLADLTDSIPGASSIFTPRASGPRAGRVAVADGRSAEAPPAAMLAAPVRLTPILVGRIRAAPRRAASRLRRTGRPRARRRVSRGCVPSRLPSLLPRTAATHPSPLTTPGHGGCASRWRRRGTRAPTGAGCAASSRCSRRARARFRWSSSCRCRAAASSD